MKNDNDEWIPETVFKVENTGKAPLEFFIIFDTFKKIEGPRLVLQSGEVKRIMFKEMLPPQYKDYRKLAGVTTSLTLNNPSTELTGSYNMEIEGPFKIPLTKQQRELQPIGLKVIAEHQDAFLHGSASDKRELIKNPIPEEYKIRKDFYTCLCHIRGKIFSSLMMPEQAEANFEDGWNDYEDFDRWFYSFDWANALMLFIGTRLQPAVKNKRIEKAIHILTNIKQWNQLSTYPIYNGMSADGMKAFCLCWKENPGEAKKMFTAFDFTPITIADVDGGDMSTFFDYFGYSIAAAIELKDAELIKNICIIISAGNEGILQEANAWRRLKMTLGNLRQRGRVQIKFLFDMFNENSINYYPELPNLTAFLKLMKRNDEAGMEKFFM